MSSDSLPFSVKTGFNRLAGKPGPDQAGDITLNPGDHKIVFDIISVLFECVSL